MLEQCRWKSEEKQTVEQSKKVEQWSETVTLEQSRWNKKVDQ